MLNGMLFLPLKGPNPQGLIKDKKQDKPIQEKKYGRY